MSMRALIGNWTAATRLAALVIFSVLPLGILCAQEGDPSGRVARLSFLQGAVSLEPAGQQDWVTAELNLPITTNDRIWSDASGSRAELDLGGAAVRLGSNTGFSFLNLDDNNAQMQVSSGTVVVHVRELLQNQAYEVDTPNVAVLLEQPGDYRFDVNETGDTTVVRVTDGMAEAALGGQTVPVESQEMVSFFGTDQVSIVPAGLGAPDGFDDWSFERDREMDQSESQNYVPQDMVGTADLDDNGEWQNTPDYGPVWIPTAVAVGWVPYAFGHWAWISPWGWTWVDDAPWGFAPFHYGRWTHWHNSWAWVPGPRSAQAVYAPALVAWAGGASSAAVAWFPLAPREVYVPGYHVSEKYVRAVNVSNTNITDSAYINNVYQNRVASLRYANSAVPGAVTSVARSVFTAAQPVNTHRSVLSAAQVGQLAPTARAPAIAPIRQSVLGASAPGLVRRPPASILNHPIVARTVPPAAVGVRVRLVGPAAQQAARSRSAVVPAQQAGDTDNRSWAERAHALEHSSLPSAAPPPRVSQPPAYRDGNSGGAVREYNEQNYHPGGVTPQELSDQYRRAPEEETEQRSTESEQARPAVNSYSRPSQAPSQVEQARPVTPPATEYQRPAETRVAPAPAQRPPATTVHPTPGQPTQHSQPEGKNEERTPLRLPSRNDQYPH